MQLKKHWAAQLDDYAIDLAWSGDGTRIAAASSAGSISIFDTATGDRVHLLPGHDGTNVLAWQRAAGLPDEGVRESAPTAPDSGGPTAPSPILASGGQDGTVKFWDTAAGQHTATAELGNSWVEHAAWRPNSSRASSPVLAAAAGRDLYFLNQDGSVRHRFGPAPKTISALAWHPGGGAIAVGYFGGVTLWDADDCIVQKELQYGNGIHVLAWSPDGKWLVSGNQDPSVHLWIPENETEFHMSGYEGKVKFISFNSTARWLATSGGREACIWDCSGAGPEGREPAMLPHDTPVCAVRFQKRHGLLATASNDGVVQLWSPEREKPLRATVRMPAAATTLEWSPDDVYLAIGSEKGAVYVLRCEP